MNFTNILFTYLCRKLALWETYIAFQIPFQLTTTVAWTHARIQFVQVSLSGFL